ncbi:MAG TPA: cytochrome c3 family protein [Polyangia bacterium]
MRRGLFAVGLVLAFASSGGCRPPPPKMAPPSHGAPLSGEVASNIARADYAGSAACRRCHASYFKSWASSPMHNMTRLSADVPIHAAWQGAFRFKDDDVRFERAGGKRYLRIESKSHGTSLWQVTKVIGGHHREDFAGVEVASEGAAPPGGALERVLPATWMIEAQQWRYKGYSVMSRERPYLRAGAVWSRTCIFCHNTEPYLSTILGALAGPGTQPYQGEVVDALLPPERRWKFQITDEDALKKTLLSEIDHLAGKRALDFAAPLAPSAVVAEAVKVTRARFYASDLIEVGIGCESCHGGSREHVEHVGISPVLEPRSPYLKVVAPPGLSPTALRAQRINRTCARCHQVLFSQYPYTWEGGLRAGRGAKEGPGGSEINSGEARDLLLGACASAMTCVDCHDPHAPDNQARMRALDGPAGSAVCIRCHTKYDTPIAVRAHTHHDPAGAGSQCLNCHMPLKNLSLDNRLTRYHRVGSPDDPQKVEGDRPLECALCHGDKTVGELVTTMESWWGKRYDRVALTALYGSLDANVMLATLARGKPHEQAVAMYSLGERKVRAAAPLIAAQLTHAIPLVRYYADRALEEILGRPTGIDLFQDDSAIKVAADKLLAAAPAAP